MAQIWPGWGLCSEAVRNLWCCYHVTIVAGMYQHLQLELSSLPLSCVYPLLYKLSFHGLTHFHINYAAKVRAVLESLLYATAVVRLKLQWLWIFYFLLSTSYFLLASLSECQHLKAHNNWCSIHTEGQFVSLSILNWTLSKINTLMYVFYLGCAISYTRIDPYTLM